VGGVARSRAYKNCGVKTSGVKTKKVHKIIKCIKKGSPKASSIVSYI
jgi:hypothetical protein